MREEIQNRLDQLRQEHQMGQARMQELEKQMAYVRETMLRISGAVQILEELMAETPISPPPANSDTLPET